MKNPKGERLVSVVRPSTLAGSGENITHIFSLCFICDKVYHFTYDLFCLWLGFLVYGLNALEEIEILFEESRTSWWLHCLLKGGELPYCLGRFSSIGTEIIVLAEFHSCWDQISYLLVHIHSLETEFGFGELDLWVLDVILVCGLSFTTMAKYFSLLELSLL
jgi:hypothetical protein